MRHVAQRDPWNNPGNTKVINRLAIIGGAVTLLVAGALIFAQPAAAVPWNDSASAAHRAVAGTVTLVDRPWICSTTVNLDVVKVTMHANENAIYLKAGCTGRIGRIEIDTWSADGVKVHGGAQDITIGGGYISCHARAGTVHQDGIQAQSGTRVTFKGLRIDCPKSPNAAFFVSRGGGGGTPTDIVCNGCTLLPANSTVNVKESIRSGVRNSVVCQGRHTAIRIQSGAVSPVNTRNTVLSRTSPSCKSTA